MAGFFPQLAFPNGRIYEINSGQQLSAEKFSELQNDIWRRFQFFSYPKKDSKI
jgi:hypothetical protein